jgi:hypothetical protein
MEQSLQVYSLFQICELQDNSFLLDLMSMVEQQGVSI